MSVPLLDLKAQFATIEDEVRAAIDGVLESQYFIMGPGVARFEAAVADYIGVKHAIGVSSGSDALLVSLMALGIGPGDEVITTPFTFFATAGAVVRLGAKPVFVDIDPDTYNMSAEAAVAAITERTRAILPVHIYGQCAEMGPLLQVAQERGIPIVEDAAQAIGARWHDRGAGSMGSLGCFSFFPSKNLGGFGDGGLVTTQDDELADKVRILRVHGGRPKYYHRVVGGNFRLDALQAAVLGVKLPHLDAWSQARRERAATYDRLFAELPVEVPVVRDHNLPIFHQYTVRVGKPGSGPAARDELWKSMQEAQVGSAIYYPVPLHLQDCFADLGYGAGDLPLAEEACDHVISLPIYPELTGDQQREVVGAVASALGV